MLERPHVAWGIGSNLWRRCRGQARCAVEKNRRSRCEAANRSQRTRPVAGRIETITTGLAVPCDGRCASIRRSERAVVLVAEVEIFRLRAARRTRHREVPQRMGSDRWLRPRRRVTARAGSQGVPEHATVGGEEQWAGVRGHTRRKRDIAGVVVRSGRSREGARPACRCVAPLRAAGRCR